MLTSDVATGNASIQRVFNLFDRDGDGKISVTDLVSSMHSMGYPMSTEEGRIIIRECSFNPLSRHLSPGDFATLLNNTSLFREESCSTIVDGAGSSSRISSPTVSRSGRVFPTSTTPVPVTSKKRSSLKDLVEIFSGKRIPSLRNVICVGESLDKQFNADMKLVFSAFDLNQDGVISYHEFTGMIEKLGLSSVFSEDELQEVLTLVGIQKGDRHATVTFQQFVDLVKKCKLQ